MKSSIVPNKKITVISLAFAVSLISCGLSREEKPIAKEYPYAESSIAGKLDSIGSLNSSAVIGSTKDSSHVFMRTADIKFSVKDVRTATYEIEHIIRKNDGFITYTNLAGTKVKDNSTRITEDSVMNTYNLNVWNEITLRVPNANLDSTLIEMDKLVDFLDTRTIIADDVKLKLMAAQLSTKRNQKLISKLDTKIDLQGKKLKETINGLSTMDNAQVLHDEQQLNLMELKDKVAYSTVKLYVYQPEKIIHEKELLIVSPNPYKPSFLSKLSDAGKTGLEIFQAILFFFVAIWPFLVLFIAVWLIVKWLVHTKLLVKLFRF